MPINRRVAGIQPPQFPKQRLSDLIADQPLQDQMTFTRSVITSADFCDQAADDVLFEQVQIKRVSLARTHLTISQMIDARCEVCDFAGAEWEKAHLSRIEWIGCRLVGLKLMDSEITDAVMTECNAEFALFWSSSFNAVRFERCNLSGASFQNTDLSGVVFKDCDLRKADLRGAKLAGADLRGSQLEGLSVGIEELQGAIIDPRQAVHVMGLLGIEVRWEE